MLIQPILTFLAAIGLALAYQHLPPDFKTTQNPIVITPLGSIQGSTLRTRLGKTIYAFRGIRYAQPPVGELRFQPPVPIEKHEGVYNATDDKPMCPQPTTDPTSEDCLYLNVYTTKLPSGNINNVKRPLIVHIHPGGFYSAGSASYWGGPQYFMDQDIILVTFNYRLGTLGFLSTGEKEAPGNNGLKDQVQVLRWIKQNIEAFGGDSGSVTIQGYSAGSISVTCHMVSPMSRGLFHKAIAMSASGTSQSPIGHNLLDFARRQAKFVGCPEGNAKEIYNCLKTIPAADLANSLPKFAEWGTDPILLWTPVIENDFGQERFLTAHPITLFMKGEFTKIPFMTGVTTDEFAFRSLYVIENSTLLKDINENWEKVAPIPFQYERNTEKSKNISRALRKFYFNDKPIDQSNLNKLGELYADSMIGFGNNRAVKLVSAKNTAPTYYYKFSYQGDYSHNYLPGTNNTKPYGVVHHDDLIYLFYISKLFPLFGVDSPKEVGMVEILTTLHANFAKYGNPTPGHSKVLRNVSWEQFNNRTEKYLDIGTKLVMREKLFDDRYSEWERLFPLEQYA
ncbi:esterase E4-like [Anthonomus grandis grandis]|uniref:esterase E4-like n=1 Tax=Anthonomus grandis grandis TaxID=2921223 RepID=UPI00216635D2|nr:esterase E4-like [Anthonomus grandis grandis]XP_050295659.1 esterase E4-like [Anthonomus grandis grandis]